jgi:hypothetical protein
MKLMMDNLSQIHNDKVMTGEMKVEMLAPSTLYFTSPFTDDQREFFSVFSACFN